MSDRTSETHFIGPLGSEFWQIQVDPEAVPLLARKIDWNGLGRRVMIDPIAGIISWMSPASTHEDLAEATDEIVKAAGQIIKGRVRGMRGTRWKRPEDPRNTGLEADASFYIGTKAEQWYAAIRQGWDKVEEFETRTPPDLVVEVEITHLDKDKPARYARLGISEMWQVTRRPQQDQYRIEVTILDLQAHGGPREVGQSRVLPGLATPSLPKAFQLAIHGRSNELQTLLDQELVSASKEI